MTEKEIQDKLNKMGINAQRVQVLTVPEKSINKLSKGRVVVFEMDHPSALYPKYLAMQLEDDT